MPKVLLVGGLRSAQSAGCLHRGLQLAGCEVRYIPSVVNTGHGKISRPLLEDDLFSGLKDGAELVIWWQAQCDEGTDWIEELRVAYPNVAFVCQNLDDPYAAEHVQDNHCRLFDIVVTCCEDERILKMYQDFGVRTLIGYPPCEQALHGVAVMDEDDRCDLSFAATNVYPKDHYPEVLLGRVEMARLVASLGELHLYGEWGHRRFDWGGECRDDELHRCFWGHRSYEQMASAFASSRVTLNSHVRPDGYRYLNERVTTGMASGTAMLCDRVNGIEELFTDMKEIALWSSAEELVEKAQWLLAHETERAAMAEAGRAVVLERYSNVRLAEDILSEAALVKGVRQ